MSHKRIKPLHRKPRTYTHLHGPSCPPGCQGKNLDPLMERLAAPYFDIDKAADELCASVCRLHHEHRVDAFEEFLRTSCRSHNINAVEAGTEEVGPAPFFLSRPRGDGFYEVALYSIRPEYRASEPWQTIQ